MGDVMIRGLLGTAFAGLLLAGCAMPEKTAAATTAANDKPACDKHTAVTGSHLTGDCDHKHVSVMGQDAYDQAMRLNPGVGMQSH
jgi:hypothetical protein